MTKPMSSGKKALLFTRLAQLYGQMDQAYQAAAANLGLSCAGCADNCCETFFQHHTYLEWAYLWEGLRGLPRERQDAIKSDAENWVRRHQNPILPGVRPRVMCPLNLGEEGEGRCGLYGHRMMICRLHGVPNVLLKPQRPVRPAQSRPGFQAPAAPQSPPERMGFPGCDRAQELGKTCEPAPLDRTPLLTGLARLEMEFVGPERMRKMPRVDLTLAEMIILGPPKI